MTVPVLFGKRLKNEEDFLKDMPTKMSEGSDGLVGNPLKILEAHA